MFGTARLAGGRNCASVGAPAGALARASQRKEGGDRMTTSDGAMRPWKRAWITIGVLAGVTLSPVAAQAQICGEPPDIAEDLLEFYVSEFEDLFTLSEQTCDAMAKEFLKACDTAVKDAVKVRRAPARRVPKAAKPACKEASQNPSDCAGDYKDDAKDDKQLVEAGANFAFGECEDEADKFWDTCRFGF